MESSVRGEASVPVATIEKAQRHDGTITDLPERTPKSVPGRAGGPLKDGVVCASMILWSPVFVLSRYTSLSATSVVHRMHEIMSSSIVPKIVPVSGDLRLWGWETWGARGAVCSFFSHWVLLSSFYLFIYLLNPGEGECIVLLLSSYSLDFP